VNVLYAVLAGFVVGALCSLGVLYARRRAPQVRPEPVAPPLCDQHERVVAFLREHPRSTVEEIAAGAGLEGVELHRALAYLQLDGVIDSSWAGAEGQGTGRLLREAFTAREKTVKP
jgi:hypothetical protein